MPQQVRVFVSHHHSPTEDTFTRRLVEDLKRASADVWFDENDILSGNFAKKISDGLSGRQWLILVMTSEALKSKWVQHEVEAAMGACNRGEMQGIIPIIAETCNENDVPLLWRVYHRLDATKDYTTARDAAPPCPWITSPC